MAGSVQCALSGHCGITMTNGQRSGWLRTASATPLCVCHMPSEPRCAPPVQRKDDGPLLTVVAPPIFRQVDLKAVGDAVQLDAAIQKSRFLRRLPAWLGAAFPAGRALGRATRCRQRRRRPARTDKGSSKQAGHIDLHHNDDSRLDAGILGRAGPRPSAPLPAQPAMFDFRSPAAVLCEFLMFCM